MKITKRDLLRIIAEESNAISAEKVLEEGTLKDIESAVAKAIQEFITMNNREPSMADVNMIVNMVMDHGDEGLVDLEAAPEFDPGCGSAYCPDPGSHGGRVPGHRHEEWGQRL